MSERIPLPVLLAELKEAAIDELHARLADEGYTDIRASHGCVFRFIAPEGSRLTYLAERSGFTKQAIGEAVDDLERLGYVERTPDPLDKRAKLILLTERGEGALLAGRRIFVEIEREWQERVGEEVVTTMREALERLTEGTARPEAVSALPTPAPLRG
jgi:DNA-binding MarR family transcriptional regulator